MGKNLTVEEERLLRRLEEIRRIWGERGEKKTSKKRSLKQRSTTGRSLGGRKGSLRRGLPPCQWKKRERLGAGKGCNLEGKP